METKQNLIRFSRYYQSLTPMLVKPEIRAYAMIVFSLVTLSFFGYFALKPTFVTVSLLNKQIKDARLVDQQLQQKINALSLAQTEYQEVKPDLDLISRAMPSEAKFPELVKSLEKISTQSGVRLKNISFKTIDLTPDLQATESGTLIPLNFDINILGDYPKLDSFITNLSQMTRLVVIDKMGFSKKDKDSVEAIIGARVFYAP